MLKNKYQIPNKSQPILPIISQINGFHPYEAIFHHLNPSSQKKVNREQHLCIKSNLLLLPTIAKCSVLSHSMYGCGIDIHVAMVGALHACVSFRCVCNSCLYIHSDTKIKNKASSNIRSAFPFERCDLWHGFGFIVDWIFCCIYMNQGISLEFETEDSRLKDVSRLLLYT